MVPRPELDPNRPLSVADPSLKCPSQTFFSEAHLAATGPKFGGRAWPFGRLLALAEGSGVWGVSARAHAAQPGPRPAAPREYGPRGRAPQARRKVPL